MGKRSRTRRSLPVASVSYASTTGKLRLPMPPGFFSALCLIGMVLVYGCASSPPVNQDPLAAAQEAHRTAFGDFELPRKVGTVDNAGLQLPVVSPDGESLLYLRTDQDGLSPMTQLGSDDPLDTPSQGTLAIWRRPLRGAEFGQRFSRQRWCHSAVWSRSGQFIAYVANEPPGSAIHLIEVATGHDEVLGLPAAVNCLPRFGPDDHTLIFCSGPAASGPFRIYRQTAGDEPAALSPETADCVLPAMLGDRGELICGRVEDDHLNWIRVDDGRMLELIREVGVGQRPALLQAWAGIAAPVSPDGLSIAFFDGLENRVGVLNMADRIVRRHRSGSLAACWLSPRAMALATIEGLFAVETETGISIPLMNGAWIPLAYVSAENRLILLGKEGSGARFSIMEMTFKPATDIASAKEKR